MIISLKTGSKPLNDLFAIPLLGSFIIFVLALFPVPLAYILNHFLYFAEDTFIERGIVLVTAVWNVILTFVFHVRISIFFIPCWLLFLIIGILRYFHVIGG